MSAPSASAPLIDSPIGGSSSGSRPQPAEHGEGREGSARQVHLPPPTNRPRRAARRSTAHTTAGGMMSHRMRRSESKPGRAGRAQNARNRAGIPTVSRRQHRVVTRRDGQASPRKRRAKDDERHVHGTGQEEVQAVLHAADDALALHHGRRAGPRTSPRAAPCPRRRASPGCRSASRCPDAPASGDNTSFTPSPTIATQ